MKQRFAKPNLNTTLKGKHPECIYVPDRLHEADEPSITDLKGIRLPYIIMDDLSIESTDEDKEAALKWMDMTISPEILHHLKATSQTSHNPIRIHEDDLPGKTVEQVYSGWFKKMLDQGRDQNEFLPILIRASRIFLGIYEEWNDVEDYEGLYRVSNFGIIKSLARQVWNGHAYYAIKERILKQHLAKKGYYTVTISKNSIMKTYEVHILMAKPFLNHTSCGFDLVVDHKDNIKTNNALSNLQIITHRKNISKDSVNKDSGYTGVKKASFGNNFTAHIGINNEYLYIGTFTCESDAGEAYTYILALFECGKSIEHIRLVIKDKYALKHSSKYKWVTWDKGSGKWMAQPYINGKRKKNW